MYEFETSFTDISGSNGPIFNKIYTAVSVGYNKFKKQIFKEFSLGVPIKIKRIEIFLHLG